jgi:hypothetical protein
MIDAMNSRQLLLIATESLNSVGIGIRQVNPIWSNPPMPTGHASDQQINDGLR